MPSASGPLKVFITIDVEYAGMAHIGTAKAGEIPEASMECRVNGQSLGLSFIVDTLVRNGLTATFFVEPLAMHHFGEAALRRTVKLLLDAGQDVQLHLHPAWLTFKDGKPHSDCLDDYPLEEQEALIRQGKGILEGMGASIRAFRAGGFAADDRSYGILGKLGISLSSSYCLGYRDQGCNIASFGDRNDVFPAAKGVWEIPASSFRIRDIRNMLAYSCKPFQVGCTSHGNLRRVVEAARQGGMECLTLLLHNFEFASRNDPDWAWKPIRGNHGLVRNFRDTCAWLADPQGRWRVTTFAEAAAQLADRGGGWGAAEAEPVVPSLNRVYIPL